MVDTKVEVTESENYVDRLLLETKKYTERLSDQVTEALANGNVSIHEGIATNNPTVEEGVQLTKDLLGFITNSPTETLDYESGKYNEGINPFARQIIINREGITVAVLPKLSTDVTLVEYFSNESIKSMSIVERENDTLFHFDEFVPTEQELHPGQIEPTEPLPGTDQTTRRFSLIVPK